MALIKIKYKNGDKDWALLDEREFIAGVHERYVEPEEKPKSDKLIDTLSDTVVRPAKKSRKR